MTRRSRRHWLVATLALVLLLLPLRAALAQTAAEDAMVERVRGTAPELVGLAGSAANFDNLVRGLAQGAEIELRSPLAARRALVVRLQAPGGPLGGAQIVATLRGARARLTALGLPNPDAQQLAAALAGGMVETPAGAFRLAGLLPMSGEGLPPGYRLSVLDAEPASASAGASARGVIGMPTPDPDLVLFAGSPENLRSLMLGLTRGGAITLTGAPPPGPPAITFTVPLPPLTAPTAAALLERARLALLREAIAAPTPLQLRDALLALS